MSSTPKRPARRVRIGLSVVFAGLTPTDKRAVRGAWNCAVRTATAWRPAFATFGLDPLPEDAHGADLIVYLGESSRFEAVAGQASRNTPVVLVKSTVEELLDRPAGAAMRYRMCTGVEGIAQALATVAPRAPTVNWQNLPWPSSVHHLTKLEPGEERYVATSVDAFRRAAEARGLCWIESLPDREQPFSVFLTMHDPAAAHLAEAALNQWPHCTVLAADGMSATTTPEGKPWPARLARVRHWSPRSRSASNRAFRAALGKPLPDLDSPGMVFGTLYFLNRAFAAGATPECLAEAGTHPGPLGRLRMTASGHPEPERIIVFQGSQLTVVNIGEKEGE